MLYFHQFIIFHYYQTVMFNSKKMIKFKGSKSSFSKLENESLYSFPFEFIYPLLINLNKFKLYKQKFFDKVSFVGYFLKKKSM